MCKAHSKVTHIKQQKYFRHLKGRGYNKNSVLYPGRLRWWKYFCCFICVTLLWALHIVIRQQFFYIYYNIYQEILQLGSNQATMYAPRSSLESTTSCARHGHAVGSPVTNTTPAAATPNRRLSECRNSQTIIVKQLTQDCCQTIHFTLTTLPIQRTWNNTDPFTRRCRLTSVVPVLCWW